VPALRSLPLWVRGALRPVAKPPALPPPLELPDPEDEDPPPDGTALPPLPPPPEGDLDPDDPEPGSPPAL
jgi:hypothetical protein